MGNDISDNIAINPQLFQLLLSQLFMPTIIPPVMFMSTSSFRDAEYDKPYYPRYVELPVTLEQNNDKSKIKKISLIKRDNGNYFVQVFMNSEAEAKTLADFCKNKGVEQGYITGNWVSFGCADPEVMAYFVEQVCIFDKYAHPKLLKSVYDHLKIFPDANYQLPLWYRKGNYQDKFYYRDSPLVRIVDFHSTSENSIFNEITICGYNDNSVQIRVSLKNQEGMVKLSRALRAENLIIPEKIDFSLKSTGFTNRDMSLIAHYLSVISKLDPTFSFIQKEIENTLKVNLNQQFKKPRWIITGDFNKVTHYHGTPLRQQLKLDYTANNQRALQSVELLGYSDDSLKMNVKLRKGNSISKLLATSNQQFPQLKLESWFDDSIYFIGSKKNPHAFVNVLRLLKQLTGNDFAQIEELLLNALKIKMRSVFTQAINEVKKSRAKEATQPIKKDSEKAAAKLSTLSLKDKMNTLFGKVKTELGIVADAVEETVDTICQDVEDAVDDIAKELESLVLDVGDGIDEAFDALDDCIPAMTNLFSCMSVCRSEVKEEQQEWQHLISESPTLKAGSRSKLG